ncbi:MAG TPA: DMT family transporter [Actinomycetota bacterium]|nr:DMT family transporter [Actinomycetota bacterium]
MPAEEPRGPDPGLLLLVIPVAWGITFPAAKLGLESMALLPFMAWTRALGFLTILVAIPLLARRELTAEALRRVAMPGLLLGALIFLGYLLQTAGLERTTATNAGFITGLYVVFVPFLALILFRRRAGWPAWAAVAVSLVGLALLSIPGLHDLRPRFGDLLVLAGAVAWAGHVVAIGHFATRHSPIVLSLAQMAVTAALHLVAAAPGGLDPRGALEIWHLLLITGVVGSGLGYTLQVFVQESVSATRAVVVLAGESVAAAAFSYVWLGERLLAHQWVGAALVLAAMVISELGARRRPVEHLEPGTAL